MHRLILFLAFGLTSPCLYAQVYRANQLSRKAYDVARTDPDSSIRLATDALRLATQAGSPAEQARAHAVLGRSAIFKSDLSGLEQHVREGLPFAAKAGNDTLLSDLHNLASLSFRFRHEQDSALTALERAERYARKGRMTTQLTNALLAKGALLSDKRQYARALEAYEECYRTDVQKGDSIGQAIDLQNIGLTLSHLQRYPAALEAFRQALPLNRNQGDKHGLIRTLISMGNTLSALNKLDSADMILSEAYSLAGELGDAIAQGAIANNLSTYAQSRGLMQRSISWARRSVNHYYATGDSARAASALSNLGDAERLMGHLPEAEKLLIRAVASARKLGETKILAQSLKILGLTYEAQGKAALAAPLYLEYATLQDTLYKYNLAEEVAGLQARHEAFIKDQKIDLLNRNMQVKDLTLAQKELQLQRQALLGGIGVLLLLILTGALYFSAKRRRLALEAGHQRQMREEQAQRFAATQAAEEAERKRIARELHDGVGQMLASVRLHMAARSGPERDFADLERMLAESSDEVRFISHNLMPQALERKGFDPAMEEFCDRIARTKRINVIPHLEPVGHLLTPEGATMLYRIMQELVSNTLKHSGASDLYLTVADNDDNVSLTVEDNGKGFDLAEAASKEGIGISNLRDRVALAGGNLDIETQPGQGALFVVQVPKRPGASSGNQMVAEEEVSHA